MNDDLSVLLADIKNGFLDIAAAIDKFLEQNKPAVFHLEEIEEKFPEDLRSQLLFEDSKKYILVRPRHYLGSKDFAKIAAIVRDMKGEYVSAGKESHFRIPR